MKNTYSLVGVLAGLLAASTVLAQSPKGLSSLDSDGDGQISRDEFQLANPQRGPRMLERGDSNGDGILTRNELQASFEANSEERQLRMRDRALEMFDATDADGNGEVTAAEAREHAFTRMDSNGDGVISADEAAAMNEKRKGMRERHGRRGQ